MYPENGVKPDGTPDPSFPDPQSPTVPHLRHHQPTTEDRNDPNETTGLRKRGHVSRSVSPGASSSAMRIRVQTPFSDLGESSANGRRKEVVVDRTMRVEELKDDLAVGRWGEEGWVREGMRLVWRGRIVRDEEMLGDVVQGVDDPVHSFHLVARRSESATLFERRRPTIPSRSTTPPAPESSTPNVSLPAATTRATTALHDSLHYLFFIARHHLCQFLDAPLLAWHDTVPPPVVEQAVAQEAVSSAIRGVAQPRLSREEGWEDWEGLFETVDSLTAKAREHTESEARALWSSRVGRSWKDGDAGETVDVELDEITYTLHLPPLALMSHEHLAHLLLYLRITSFIPLFVPIIEHETRISASALPIPTRTRIIRTGVRPGEARVLLRLRIPTIPMPVLMHMGYSAIKIAGMLWMLTRGMKWDDTRFWVMAGAAAGWWVADGFGVWNRARPAVVIRPDPQAAVGAAEGGGPENAGGVDAPIAGAQGVAGLFAARNRARQERGATFASSTAAVPLLHLATDSAQLGSPSATDAGRHRTTPVRNTPPRIQTQLLLPFLLWFITLIPEWENIRARAIRRRERAMRAVVADATSAHHDTADDGREGELGDAARPNVYPAGLNAVAKRYYERVIARGEGVDWEEEREAQRAMGIPEEEEGGAGMGMRML